MKTLELLAATEKRLKLANETIIELRAKLARHEAIEKIAKEVNRLLNENWDIHPDSPIHEKLAKELEKK